MMNSTAMWMSAALAALGIAASGCAEEGPNEHEDFPRSVTSGDHHEHSHVDQPRALQVPGDSCTTEQRAQIGQVARLATAAIQESVATWSALENRDTRGSRWFGTNLTLDQRLRIQSYMISIEDSLVNAHVGYQCEARCSSANTIAFVRSSLTDRTVYLCPKFWTLPRNGFNSQTDTFIHENAHLIGVLNDIYGMAPSANLAINNPESAINNADNYAYYAVDGGSLSRQGAPMSPTKLMR